MKLNKTKTESVFRLLNIMMVWFEILLHIDIPHCNMQHPFEARRVNLKTCLSKMRPRSRSSIGHCIERHYGDFFRIRCPFPRHSDSEPGKRKRSAESGASALMGGIATNKITTFLVEADRGSGSGTKIIKSASLVRIYMYFDRYLSSLDRKTKKASTHFSLKCPLSL